MPVYKDTPNNRKLGRVGKSYGKEPGAPKKPAPKKKRKKKETIFEAEKRRADLMKHGKESVYYVPFKKSPPSSWGDPLGLDGPATNPRGILKGYRLGYGKSIKLS